ncbi:conserved hypothetical protein [Hyphomicrobiales bacterium]|nr:conserved hypothetical protein [Hyphomicrobiales bacterium]CAH1700278.1 conserved hypothetical protein [Hyphomicrobiales bacterium]CAI0344056.1 conserved hypothetical protein [Hyphomicrobiales bacterium]
MHLPNRNALNAIRRFTGRLAIAQILREDFLYEVHGPFVVSAPAEPRRSLARRLSDRLSDRVPGFRYRGRALRKAARPSDSAC